MSPMPPPPGIGGIGFFSSFRGFFPFHRTRETNRFLPKMRVNYVFIPSRYYLPGFSSIYSSIDNVHVRPTVRTTLAVFVLFAGAGVLVSGCMSASSDPLPRRAVYVRGTVQSLSGPLLTVETDRGPVPVKLASPSRVSMVVASDRGHLKDGSYMGITSVTQPDGSLRAIEVHIFPPGERRTGEGSFAWDLSSPDGGGMTVMNGTTSHAFVVAPLPGPGMDAGKIKDSRNPGTIEGRRDGGTSLTLQFKSDLMTRPQALTIPWGIPIVTFIPARTWDLKPGAHVLVIASQKQGGELSADRVLVGKNGLVPSM